MRKINLVTPQIIEETKIREKQFSILITLGVIVVIPVILGVFSFLKAGVYAEQLRGWQEKKNKYFFSDQVSQIKDLQSQVEALVLDDPNLYPFREPDSFGQYLLLALSNMPARGVQLEELTMDKQTGGCQLKGSSFDMPSVGEFKKVLEGLDFFKAVDIKELEKNKESLSGKITFVIWARFKKPGEEEDSGI